MQKTLVIVSLVAGMCASGCLTPYQARQTGGEKAPAGTQDDSLRAEVQRLRTALYRAEQAALQAREAALKVNADTDMRLNQFAEQLRIASDRLDDLDNRVSNMPGKLRLATEKSGEAAPGSVSAPAPAQSDSRGEQVSEATMSKLYDAAYQDLVRGQFELAREGFLEFLRRFPQSPLADNAQYWIAESFYSQQQYARAAAEFAEVPAKYPEGDKVAAAILKRAYSFISLSKRTEARGLLEEVVRRFPNSGEAELARVRLKDL